MYAPTYRDTDRKTKGAQKVPLDLSHVLDTLEKTTGETWKCLVRAHYYAFGMNLDSSDARMLNVTAYPEMAELLLISDALLTDYSSCAGDFILLRRPVFLYQDDLEEYTSENRALYFDMKDSPYWVAATQAELDKLIADCTPERAKENCDAILKFYGENETGQASKLVAEYIIDKLKN
jgi:Putative glycosyl/glycerophosphate transferases involved in teichoic acid biosynthesis TagF/TagB/EpsJ/RodC